MWSGLGFVNNSLQKNKADKQGLLHQELPSFSALIPVDTPQANLLKEANTPHCFAQSLRCDHSAAGLSTCLSLLSRAPGDLGGAQGLPRGDRDQD